MAASLGSVLLIPTFLYEDNVETIPQYIIEQAKGCTVFFVENEKTARRYLKRVWNEMVIDDYKWHTIHKAEKEVIALFMMYLNQDQTIGIISEAGCPCIADPGQILVNKAQQLGARVKPLVGPNSILLALMASGMNGQKFQFNGYLPIESTERKKAIKELEVLSLKSNCTQIFIETPYRNNQLIKEILGTCKESTLLCIAIDLTAKSEFIKTKTINEWKKTDIDFHKRLGIFLINASN